MPGDVNYSAKWEADYERNTDGWDLGGPTPVFKRLLELELFEPGRLIAPGAGRGHDAREFARHGFEVTAVDFSAFAVREMQRLADPQAPLEILQCDLFDLPRDLDHFYDYVFDYTCFCALDPRRRGEYADLIARLLRPGGFYIDLAFPLDERKGGPPFATSFAEIFTLFRERGFALLEREVPVDSVPQRRGFEELLLFQTR